MDQRPISSDNEIEAYMHCGLCLQEKPDDMSPREFSDSEVGMTPQGLQIWCKRHECNVIHIDFQGEKHPANTTRKLPEEEPKKPHLKIVTGGK